MKRTINKNWAKLTELSVLYLKPRLWLRRVFNTIPEGNLTSIYKGYGLIFNECFYQSNLNKRKWRIGQDWGVVHPKYPYQYSDKSCIEITDKEGLILTNRYSPKTITQWEGQEDEFTADCTYARGEIESKQSFFRGIFEIKCIIPNDKNITTAFWLSGGNSREIDIFEFFSKHLKKNSIGMSITPHWDVDGEENNNHERDMLPKVYRLPKYINDKLNTYTLIWTENKLDFLFNGLLIRRIKNKKLLKSLDKPMEIILSNGLSSEPNPVDNNLANNPFIIKSIKVWQKK